jgi:hypothetical protein
MSVPFSWVGEFFNRALCGSAWTQFFCVWFFSPVMIFFPRFFLGLFLVPFPPTASLPYCLCCAVLFSLARLAFLAFNQTLSFLSPALRFLRSIKP